MPRRTKHIDRPFLITALCLTVLGFFIFSSASLGLLTRDGVQFSDVALSQLLLGIGGGLAALFTCIHVPYRLYKQYSPYLFGIALLLTALVFVPGLGYEANGATRWLDVFGISFQPAELLKVTFVLALAWYYNTFHRRINNILFSLGGVIGALVLSGILLLLQPDTGTFAILIITGGAMAVVAGTRVQHLLVVLMLCVLGLTVLVVSRPYLLDRITTFIDPSNDPQGSGYQIRQSLIAIGSGGMFGRGFGQSVQKFDYLPEPIGDSIFSVAAEEFGFLGSIVIIGLFVFFAIRGIYIASRVPDRYGGLIVTGLVILIISQSFINMASMVGLMPLTGEPLVFISHGGTSLFFALVSVGIILNVSRYQK